MTSRIRVLVIDDSALVRRALTECLSRCPDIEVVGTAMDPYVARDKILELHPDVLTLDIEMPRMDGLTFLKLLMERRPMPVVVLSSLTGPASAKALEALQAGAVEVLLKPSAGISAFEDDHRLYEVIKGAARARVARFSGGAPGLPAKKPAGQVPAPGTVARRFDPRAVILVGASTGGTEALRVVLSPLRTDLPGICVVQHIPAQFSLALAQRLDRLCALEVREAKDGDNVLPGLVLIAPGGYHVVLEWHGHGYRVRLNEGPKIHYQRPAVDVLFRSAINAGAAPHALAMLLTGMGADGAAAMLELREAGARTMVQDEASCVVFGMPREAIRMGAAESILPLDHLASRLEHHADSIALRAGTLASARTDIAQARPKPVEKKSVL